jgi:hypothetical protein
MGDGEDDGDLITTLVLSGVIFLVLMMIVLLIITMILIGLFMSMPPAAIK